MYTKYVLIAGDRQLTTLSIDFKFYIEMDKALFYRDILSREHIGFETKTMIDHFKKR